MWVATTSGPGALVLDGRAVMRSMSAAAERSGAAVAQGALPLSHAWLENLAAQGGCSSARLSAWASARPPAKKGSRG